jgi:hypothetical protein
MNEARTIGRVRATAFVLGIVGALVTVLGWSVPRGDGALNADVVVTAMPTGELDVTPLDPFISASSLAPGADATGSVAVYNETGATLAIRIGAEPSTRDLDDLLWVEVTSGGRSIYRGTLGGLREGSTSAFTLRSARSTTLDVRTWLPAGTSSGYEGRIDQINLTFDPGVVAR